MKIRSLFSSLTMERFITLLFLAYVFLLALCKIEEVDAWLHLAYGRAIWDMKSIPDIEPYIYSMAGKPFVYTSWLFGVVFYGAYKLLNVNGVILLKATIITLTFYVLLKDSLRPKNNYLPSVILLSFIALIARHRFVERPDIILFLFLSFSVFALNTFVHDQKKYLYALPIVHLLWANSHTSISLMFLPFGAFLFGGLCQRFFYEKRILTAIPPSQKQLRTVLFVFIASFLATLANPNFIHQYTLGAQFLGNEWARQNIIELRAATWPGDKTFFLFAPLVLLSFFVSGRRTSVPLVLLLLPVFYLAFMTRRFTFVFFILAGPVLARNLAYVIPSASGPRSVAIKRLAISCAVLWLVVSASLTLAQAKPFGNREKAFGFGVNYARVPEGALAYMDAKKITGRVMNSFAWGQYIIWRDFPRRAVIVDGRVNVPSELMVRMQQSSVSPDVLDELERAYGFESILMYYDYEKTSARSPENKGPFDAALNHPGWALVYWDDRTLLYVKRDGPYAAVAREDEYRLVKPANNLDLLVPMLSNRSEQLTILSELRRNIATTGSMTAFAYLGHVYNHLGKYREAIACFENVGENIPRQSLVRFAYTSIAHAEEMLGNYQAALRYYERSLREEDNAAVHERIEQLHGLMKK